MRTPRQHSRARGSTRGFALVTTVLVLTAVALLTVGLFTVMRYETAGVGAHVRAYRAELGVESGLNAAMGALAEATRDDLGVIFTLQGEKDAPDDPGQPVLMAARHDGSTWNLTPLRSGSWQPAPSPGLRDLEAPPAGETALSAPAWQDLRADWEEMPGDEDDAYTIRFAWAAEDLQGRVPAHVAGNREGEGNIHRRVGPGLADSAPGLAPPASQDDPDRLRDMALWVLDPDATGPDDTAADGLDDLVIAHRSIAPTTGTFQAIVGSDGSRDPGTGRLTDPAAAALEENLATTLRPYHEAALVPPLTREDGRLVYQSPGEPQLDLNALLEESPEEFVEQFTTQVNRQMPEWGDNRQGGFPEDYVATLAAAARDYADEDDDPTLSDDYKGIEAYPVVSEHYMRFRRQDIVREDGVLYQIMTLTPYVELWNPTDKPLMGQFEFSLEANYEILLNAEHHSFTGPPTWSAGDPDVCTPLPRAEAGGTEFWCPPVGVDDTTYILPRVGGPSGPLRPNEYRQFQLETYTFKFVAGQDDEFLVKRLALNEDRTSSYKLRWNGQLVDEARGNIMRRLMTLYYPNDGAAQSRQQVRGGISGHSYKPAGWVNNMGDPRMARYIGIIQDSVTFPESASPGRRNIRWTTYRDDPAKVYGRVKHSEWPDGGPDTPFGAAVNIPDDHRINPDDPRFYVGAPPVKPENAPQKLSNRGRFLTLTELGRLYDPVMWDQGLTRNARDTSVLESIDDDDVSNPFTGGGNTLRIGRGEHPMFDRHGARATHLLDLFHVNPDEDSALPGGFRRIDGHVNVNTATRETLRVLLAGSLTQDPMAGRILRDESIRNSRTVEKVVRPMPFSAPAGENGEEAGAAADAIIRHREEIGPFHTPAELANVQLTDGVPLFGSLEAHGYPRFAGGNRPAFEWNDAIAEELFGRIWNASTVRSRHFRVHVTAEVVAKRSGRVLARRSRVYHLFLDPGPRDVPGDLAPGYPRAEILYASDT